MLHFLSAQDSEEISSSGKNLWFEGGAGAGGDGVAVNGNLDFQLGNASYLSAGFLGAYSTDGLFSDWTDAETVYLCLGGFKRNPLGMVKYSGGISYVNVTEFQRTGGILILGFGETIKTQTVGFTGSFGFSGGKNLVGIGVKALFNLNTEFPFAAIVLNLRLGKIK